MVERAALFLRLGRILDPVVDRVLGIGEIDPDIQHLGFTVDPPGPDQWRHAVKLRTGPCQWIQRQFFIWPKTKSDATNEISWAHEITQNRTVNPTPDQILCINRTRM